MNYVFRNSEQSFSINEAVVLAIYCMLRVGNDRIRSEGCTYGLKVAAIKFLRTVRSMNLKEAKDIVDLIEAHGTLPSDSSNVDMRRPSMMIFEGTYKT
jgi:hypothetical protein